VSLVSQKQNPMNHPTRYSQLTDGELGAISFALGFAWLNDKGRHNRKWTGTSTQHSMIKP
jgi:hypothetical protein